MVVHSEKITHKLCRQKPEGLITPLLCIRQLRQYPVNAWMCVSVCASRCAALEEAERSPPFLRLCALKVGCVWVSAVCSTVCGARCSSAIIPVYIACCFLRHTGTGWCWRGQGRTSVPNSISIHPPLPVWRLRRHAALQKVTHSTSDFSPYLVAVALLMVLLSWLLLFKINNQLIMKIYNKKYYY